MLYLNQAPKGGWARNCAGNWMGIGAVLVGLADCWAGNVGLPDSLCVGRGERGCVGWR